jgi:hypothetical protein
MLRTGKLWIGVHSDEECSGNDRGTAMKNAVEMKEAFRFKLQMFGVPIERATNVLCNNKAVCKNTAQPKSTLTKKHHSITYHRS